MPRPTGRVVRSPSNPMLYTVRLQYGAVVEAASQEEAYHKVCKKLRESPGMYISRVEPGGGAKRKRSLLGMFFLGP